MADDINKNIVIQITAQTSQLEQSINNLNTIITSLLAQQKQLTDAGNQNSATFQNNADKIDIYTKSLQNATTQLNSYLTILNSSASTLQKNQSLIAALTAAKDKYSTSVGNNSKKVAELNTAIKTLSASAQQQQAQNEQGTASLDAGTKSLATNAKQATGLQSSLDAVSDTLKQQTLDLDNSKTAFNAHKAVMDHLKTSFDEVKDVSGEFGPSLQDAAQGFNLMKSGLSVVKDGLNGVGDALKADGFDFLLQILQLIFDAFVNSATGSKMLKGAISAIGVVVNEVKGFFNSFMNGLIQAVSHPIDSIKSLGTMIEQNIINRFTAFGKILDGLIHLDFKKVADGAIQAVTGIANATGKLTIAFTKVEAGVRKTAASMVTAYKTGFSQSSQDADTNHKKIMAHINTQQKGFKKLKKTIQNVNNDSNSTLLKTASVTKLSTSSAYPDEPVLGEDGQKQLAQPVNPQNNGEQDYASLKLEEEIKNFLDGQTKKKQAIKDFKDFELQTAGQVSSAAFSILQNSIKQQTDAKLAALENQKNSELSNSNLTSAQKIAIEAQFKKKEDAVKLKAFKQEQEAALAQAVINGALAITKVTSQTGVLSPLVIPEIIAETAIEIAKITAEKPPAYASGGLHYSSDGRGGVLPGYSRTDNTNAYLRSGEGIVVSEAMRAPWARNLVSAINVGFGGRDFSITNPGRGYAVGGIFTDGGNANRYYNAPVNDQKNLANTIAYQMINNFPPVYVDVKDINNQQNILAQTINRVNL